MSLEQSVRGQNVKRTTSHYYRLANSDVSFSVTRFSLERNEVQTVCYHLEKKLSFLKVLNSARSSHQRQLESGRQVR